MKYFNVVTDKPEAAETIAEILSGGQYKERKGTSYEIPIFDFKSNINNQNCEMSITPTNSGLKNMLDYYFPELNNNWKESDLKKCFDLEITTNFTKILKNELDSKTGLIIWTNSLWKESEILYEVKMHKKLDKHITIYRANIAEYNKNTIQNAIDNLKKLDLSQNNLMDSIAVRKEIDLRTGAGFTRYQTVQWQNKIPNSVPKSTFISYGSCQIPTLGFVVDRYKEIEQFVPEIFWKLNVVHTIYDLKVEFNWDRNRLFEKDLCEKYLSLCLTNPKATVENVAVQMIKKLRPVPMNTAELLKLCSKKLNININETMKTALKLYTEGLISYPRTGTNCFSQDMNLRSLIEQQTSHPDWGEFAKTVLEWGPNPHKNEDKKFDQVNPPIHPTKLPTKRLNGNEARVYELIVRHFLACVSKDATGSETIVTIDIAGEKFQSNGLAIYQRNYLDVYLYDEWDAKNIHYYKKGQVFAPTEISMLRGLKIAPNLLTDVDLIELMELHSIGRDGTYATHIQTIKNRKYIEEKKNVKSEFDEDNQFGEIFLKPLPLGEFLYEGYNALQLDLAKPKLRADFEKDLNAIRLGLRDADDVLSEQINIYKCISQKLTKNISEMDKIFERIMQKSIAAQSIGSQNKSELLSIQNNKSLKMEVSSTDSDDQSFDSDSENSDGENSTVCPDNSINSTKRKSRSIGIFFKIKSPKKE